jgi:hypothetical protein
LPATDIEEVLRAVAHDLDPDDIPGWRASTQLELAKVITRRALGELQQMSLPHAAH